MTQIQIFKDNREKIDLSTLVDSRMLLCANSGGGKSYAVRKLVEESCKDVQCIIFDVEGEFKTLRQKFDFLLIGEGGDVPINMEAAKLLPQKILELNVSTILDISDLKKHERIMYVKHFLEALMELPRQLWRPCLVVIDEAHLYCGQQEKQESTAVVIDLMTRGRKRGFCGILCTQRIAKLHKDAAAECNNYLIGRTGLDIDMKRAAEILGFTSKDDMLSLRDLEAGEFFVFGTAISRHVVKQKVAEVQTVHPKVGMDIKGKIQPPTEKVKAMLSKLNDLPKEAKERAKTTEDLKRKVRELEHQLANKPAAPATEVDDEVIKSAYRNGAQATEREYHKRVSTMKHNVMMLKRRLDEDLPVILKEAKRYMEIALEAINYYQSEAGTIGDQIANAASKPYPVIPRVIPQKVKPVFVVSRAGEPTEEHDGQLGKCERSILSLLYNNPEREFKKTNVALFTGYSHTSGGFNNAISRLTSMKLIKKNGDVISILAYDHAAEILGDDINLHEEFTIDNWAQKLPACERNIFEFLMVHHDEISKEELGERTGYQATSGGFNNAISRLNSLGLIIRGKGTVKLNEEIFEK